MSKVKFLVLITNSDFFPECDIIAEDGGVASLHHNGEGQISDLYRTRINPKTDLETVWELMSEGNAHWSAYEGVDEITDAIVTDCANWLFACSEGDEHEYIRKEVNVDGTWDEIVTEFLKNHYKDEDYHPYAAELEVEMFKMKCELSEARFAVYNLNKEVKELKETNKNLEDEVESLNWTLMDAEKVIQRLENTNDD